MLAAYTTESFNVKIRCEGLAWWTDHVWLPTGDV